MGERDESLDEVLKLINEQMKALKDKVSAKNAKEFAQRNEQIEKLLRNLAK
jgi:DNA anti-recombination protein RmuC